MIFEVSSADEAADGVMRDFAQAQGDAIYVLKASVIASHARRRYGGVDETRTSWLQLIRVLGSVRIPSNQLGTVCAKDLRVIARHFSRPESLLRYT